jgi:hypothetical protein
MSIIYVQVATFVSEFSMQIQMLVQVQPNVGRKLQKVILQVEETFQTKYRINL